MALEHNNENIDDSGKDAAEKMAEHGITCVRTNQFLYGGFRYTHLEDAIAEARRHPLVKVADTV